MNKTFEEYLEEAIRVEGQDHYRYTHGKRPGGTGNWIIGIGVKTVDFQKHKAGQDYIEHRGKLQDALNKAKAVAKQKGKTSVYIQT